MPQFGTKTRRQIPREMALRTEVLAILAIGADELREWNTIICPDCRRDVRRYARCSYNHEEHLPPLYYALAPEQRDGDMPLGTGVTAAEALEDLITTLRLPLFMADLIGSR